VHDRLAAVEITPHRFEIAQVYDAVCAVQVHRDDFVIASQLRP
jgi:hypothetical protein